MTETKMSYDFIKGCSNTILNDTMQLRMEEVFKNLPLPEIDDADVAYAREITEKTLGGVPNADPEHPIHWELNPYFSGKIKYEHGSTDVGDVSWVCPTAQCHTSTIARGTPGHSWQVTAQGKAPLAHKMTLYASKAMAGLAVELIRDCELLEKAKAEHKALVGPEGYQCPIPKGVVPRPMTSFLKK